MFSRIGAAAYRKDLTNTIALCDYLGNPEKKFKSVHIAGTNGKGSSSHMMASVLQESGYKTGLYTSPHLKDFRERIRINGEWIEEDFVVDFVRRIEPMIDQLDPSFFEITVVMAFDYFVKEAIDIAVVEVGLGGRLDSTNIIEPELSIITNISYDHMNLLGDTLEKIAEEKAGIIKKGVPVVLGEFQPATHHVFEQRALEHSAPIEFADQKRFVADWKFEKKMLIAEVTSPSAVDKQHYSLDLTGIYQIKNLLTTLEAVDCLREKNWKIPEEALARGLARVKKNTGLHGRWEQIHDAPMLVLDVGHNEDGIHQITRQIEITDHESLHIVLGLVKDKEIDKILSLLPKQAVYYFTRAQIPRALPEDQLAMQAHTAGLNGKTYPRISEAVQAAISHSHPKDLVLVCGSVFVVGEVDLGEIRF